MDEIFIYFYREIKKKKSSLVRVLEACVEMIWCDTGASEVINAYLQYAIKRNFHHSILARGFPRS